jgi:hypothetical protein
MAMYNSVKLRARLKELSNWSIAIYNHFVEGAPHTQWMIPNNTDIMDPSSAEANMRFVEENLQPALVAAHEAKEPYLDVMQINMQINALASLERSFRGRHLSPVRALYASAGRHLGQSEVINAAIA